MGRGQYLNNKYDGRRSSHDNIAGGISAFLADVYMANIFLRQRRMYRSNRYGWVGRFAEKGGELYRSGQVRLHEWRLFLGAIGGWYLFFFFLHFFTIPAGSITMVIVSSSPLITRFSPSIL